MLGERELYAKAVADGRAKDQLMDVVRRYFKRYPVSLVNNIEPSPEDLANIDDAAPDKEMPAPNENSLSAKEYGRQLVLYKAEQATLDLRIGVSVLSRHIVASHLSAALLMTAL